MSPPTCCLHYIVFQLEAPGRRFVGCGLTPHLLCEGPTDTHPPCPPSTRVYHRGTQSDRLRAAATGRQVWAAWDFDGMHPDEGRDVAMRVTQTSSTPCLAAAHAAPALVASPRLPHPRSRPAPPIHLLFTAPSPWPSPSPTLRAGAPSSTNHLIYAFVCLECVVTVRAARGQASTQHAYGPLATVPHSECRTRATTPRDGIPRVESFYEPTGLRTSQV
ncbi:hypothetical protein DFH08DRAFT_820507 [Mycena albidolilacea]|uniref:Uncharacterized protein n=1 Tax=Mycena albidolilacea TaxID=1033008 RepID=A0AAD6ZDA2_9AGAR|nr:hypothetical protein DFH08DRAFT_820507 [Mycena albidolilacea]